MGLEHMKAILGVTGGIAAYKAAEVARSLMERGVVIQVVMTAGAQEFVRPLTFAALTGQKVITGMFGAGSAEETLSSSVEHIRVAQDNQVLVIAPATADAIAKFAHGLANDFLSTLYLAFKGPVVIAPAMNTNMWEHPATRENVETLRKRGHVIVEPGEGLLACGTYGPGRLAEPEEIVDTVLRVLNPRRDLEGETVLITAGPTQEPLDPVRYVSNRSSGKMGYSLAEAAVSRGARVILVSGPVHLPEPRDVTFVQVTTARDMYKAVMDHLPEATIIIKSAAVADYHLAEVPKQKVKKTATRFSLELEPTPDILAEAGKRKGDRLLIGFAAETQNLLEEARRKLASKNCDMVVANLVSQEGIGFESDSNEVTLVSRSGEVVPLKRAGKRLIAEQIFDHVMKLRLALHAAQ
jgi:phosphopantothenoylcysteine decarboxylase/phosphopantothenate--cysteine ligase